MKLDISARTDVGLVRAQNEDSFSLWTPKDEDLHDVSRLLLTVADGMGGHPGGEIASQIAVQSATDLMASELVDPPVELMYKVFASATEQIHARGVQEPAYREMGTTLSAVYVEDGLAHIGHIGDTRVYWIRNSEWVQVTRDHTVAQELVDSGKLDADLADDHPMSNVLTRCLGVCPDHHPDVLENPLALEDGDCLLLATDGLSKTVHSHALTELITEMEADQGTKRLIEAALSGGAPDNVTVLLLRAISVGTRKGNDGVVLFGSDADVPWVQIDPGGFTGLDG